MARLLLLITCLTAVASLWPGSFTAAQSNSVALPIISTSPADGYAYAVIQTFDQNTGRTVYIVCLRPTFWSDWGRSLVGTVTTAVVGLLGWIFKSEVAGWLGIGKRD